jgi:hypothetical protein
MSSPAAHEHEAIGTIAAPMIDLDALDATPLATWTLGWTASRTDRRLGRRSVILLRETGQIRPITLHRLGEFSAAEFARRKPHHTRTLRCEGFGRSGTPRISA